MAQGYIPPHEYEKTVGRKSSRKEADKQSALEERQASTVRRNLHNFAQLEAAGFPGTVTLEFNRWIDSKIIGGLAGVVLRKPVRKTHQSTRIITTGTEDGYFIHDMEGMKGSREVLSGTGFAVTNKGVVYRAAQWSKDRNCAEIDEMGVVSFRKPYDNHGVNLQDYIGEDRAASTVPEASGAEAYAVRVYGSEVFSAAFDNFTRRTLNHAGIEYAPIKSLDAKEPRAEEVEAPTEERPIIAAPASDLVTPVDHTPMRRG